MQSVDQTSLAVSGQQEQQLESQKKLTIIVYALQAASFLVGITFLVAVIVNYIKLPEVRHTWLESHFRWQIKTFWFGLLWSIIGIVTFFFVVGWFIIIADAVWVVYRIVKGFLYLTDGKQMYALYAKSY